MLNILSQVKLLFNLILLFYHSIFLGFSNKSETNTINEVYKEPLSEAYNNNNNVNKNLNDTFQNFQNGINSGNNQMLVDNNSNKSMGNSNKKKSTPKRAEKKSKIRGNLQIDYLSIKRNKTPDANNSQATNII